jgi:hypothetical protein
MLTPPQVKVAIPIELNAPAPPLELKSCSLPTMLAMPADGKSATTDPKASPQRYLFSFFIIVFRTCCFVF